MTQIQSVLGPMPLEQLGFTLMHEHILVASWSMRQAFDDWVDRDALVERAVTELDSAAELGVRSMVDLTPINLGRDIHLIREVAERTGVQVLAATGYYWTEEPWLEGWEAERLADYLVRDVEQGIQGTPSRAAIIKCATDHLGVTELNRKLLRVTALAHRRTGVPISTHTSVAQRTGLGQQDVFEEAGVDLSRVVIGHCGDSEDLEYLEAILRRGSFIGMDRFGLDLLLPGEKRVSTVAELCRRGWAERIVLSHDACCHLDFFPAEQIRQLAPNWSFRHICDDVIPALRKAGVSESDLETMTVGNPRRVFERQDSY